MSDLDGLIKAIPIDQIAGALGVDQATTQQAVLTALPTILAGLHHNAQSDQGASDLAAAVAGKDTNILNGLSLDQIDAADGAKILSHIFGGGNATEQVASGVAAHLSGTDILSSVLGQVLGGGAPSAPAPTPAPAPTQTGVSSDLVKKLLPLLAPIVLTWLAQQATQKGGQVSAGSGGLLQDVLGGLLKGAGQQADNQSTTSVVTDILGSILRSR
jgi:hypothetical protein